MKKLLVLVASVVILLLPGRTAAQGDHRPPRGATLEFNFATPVVTAPSQRPGYWYTNRHDPCGLVSPETAPDRTKNTLQESICQADYQGAADSFHNTQGRNYDVVANTYSVSIGLYVPLTWKTQNARLAGFWATVFDSDNNAGDFPIIEFQGPITSNLEGPSYHPNGGVAGFYGYDNTDNNFVLIGLPAGFHYNDWVYLTITLIPGTGFRYTVSSRPDGHDGLSITSPLSDSNDAMIGNVILQGYNYGSAGPGSYSIFWKNLEFSFTQLVGVDTWDLW
jgi:hypothetical protein